ncbi:MAG: class I SAM-dependent methyltransferase [Candidatus Bathyarchaeota archaeon]|nr:class I SAM-dependent methyltransferase [Candidatus Bathyarchaeota archaeon]
MSEELGMDFWKLMDIVHKKQEIMNPMSDEKLKRLCRLLDLKQGASVLDIACGKGEFLVRLHELYKIQGIGVDKSPYCIKDCLKKKAERAPDSDLTFLEMDAADYQPNSVESFDLASCMGASWIYDGHEGALKALSSMTKPGGLIVAGEPYWRKEPVDEYLAAEEESKDTFGTYMENVETGEDMGLRCIYTLDSTLDDWDQYESLHWWAVNEYIRDNPDDPDNHEIRKQCDRFKEIYLKWGRDTMGWAIYVFRKPESSN